VECTFCWVGKVLWWLLGWSNPALQSGLADLVLHFIAAAVRLEIRIIHLPLRLRHSFSYIFLHTASAYFCICASVDASKVSITDWFKRRRFLRKRAQKGSEAHVCLHLRGHNGCATLWDLYRCGRVNHASIAFFFVLFSLEKSSAEEGQERERQ